MRASILKRILIGTIAVLIPLALSVMFGIWLLQFTPAFRAMHPTVNDAQTANEVWNELHDGLSHRLDITDSEIIQISSGPARRWAIHVTIIGVDNTTDQDLMIGIVKDSMAKRPTYSAWIEFYLRRIEKEGARGTIYYYNEELLREVDIPAQNPDSRISLKN